MVAVVITDEATAKLMAIGSSIEDEMQGAALIGQAADVLLEEIRKIVRATFRNQSGDLENSFSAKFILTSGVAGFPGAEHKAAVVSDSPYAAIQDHGGTILPRVAKNLAIPLPGAGVPKGKWPRDFPKGELTLITSRAGNKLLARVGKNRIKPVFVLKPSVTLHPTDYLKRAARISAPLVADVVENFITLTIEREL